MKLSYFLKLISEYTKNSDGSEEVYIMDSWAHNYEIQYIAKGFDANAIIHIEVDKERDPK